MYQERLLFHLALRIKNKILKIFSEFTIAIPFLWITKMCIELNELILNSLYWIHFESLIFYNSIPGMSLRMVLNLSRSPSWMVKWYVEKIFIPLIFCKLFWSIIYFLLFPSCYVLSESLILSNISSCFAVRKWIGYWRSRCYC